MWIQGNRYKAFIHNRMGDMYKNGKNILKRHIYCILPLKF